MIQQKIPVLIDQLKSARQRTLELIKGLGNEQMIGPKLKTVNPLLWEIGHVAYFYEFWVLREVDLTTNKATKASILPQADSLYDSITIAHETRWDLPLLSLNDTLDYMQRIMDDVIARLKSDKVNDVDVYRVQYAIFHEDMHTEAFTYTRQTLNYTAPNFLKQGLTTELNNVFPQENNSANKLPTDVQIPNTQFMLGSDKDIEFCFDNEKWAHDVTIQAFQISRTATSYAEYAAFVEEGGYQNAKYWDAEGWTWLKKIGLDYPLYWKKDGNSWLIKHFDQWLPMQPNTAVIHISWYEAMAWCRWAGRRLPTEAEWELAASGHQDNNNKTNYPWGNDEPTPDKVNMDGYSMRTIDVNALEAGDSAFGCRQMLGNVWEWTADTFEPYADFKADMYADYSQPLFGITKVLKGGAWTTRSRMIRNTWRNYYGPDRNDVFAGFRSCAL